MGNNKIKVKVKGKAISSKKPIKADSSGVSFPVRAILKKTSK